MICIVDEPWIWHAKFAATLLLEGDVAQRYDDFRRPVHVLQAKARRIAGKRDEEISIFRAQHQMIYIASDLAVVPQSLRLAADAVVDVFSPTGRHFRAARRLGGADDVDVPLADCIVEHSADIVIGLAARQSLAGFDLSMFGDDGEGPRSPTLSELPGYGPAREWIRAIKKDVADWRQGRVAWSDVDRGLALIGPPGTGKTLFATALANELGFELVSTSIGAWQGSNEGYLGNMLSAMSKSFADATSRRGAVLFVDELDAIGDRMHMRADHTYYQGNVIGRFLELTTHALEQPGTIVVGATNYGSLIDNAILRSGRLETHVTLDLPDEDERAQILSYHLGAALSVDELRTVTDELRLVTPADLEKLARAAKRAARNRAGPIALQDLISVVPARIPLPADVLRRICVHEVGHALMAMASGIAEVTSIRVEGHMVEGEAIQDGGRVHYKMLNRALPTERDLMARIRIMLGGTAAEEVVFGSRSIGAGGSEGSDLDQATRVAYRYASSYGLGKSLRYQAGAARIDETFVPTPELRTEVDAILGREYRATKELLSKEKNRLMRMAAELAVDREMVIESSQSGSAS